MTATGCCVRRKQLESEAKEPEKGEVERVVRMGARAAVLGALVVLATMMGILAASAAGAVLPDGRGYELISPAAKNGVDVVPQTLKTHVRPDGNAVTFSALGGFGSVEGSAFDFEYLSQRTGASGTSGWSTHGINPLGRGGTLQAVVLGGHVSTFVDGFASDLTAGIYKTWQPLVSAPNVAGASNLYRVNGLNGGARSVQLLTDAVAPIPAAWFTFMGGFFASNIQPQFAGISSDLRHVVFESRLQLTSDAPPYPAGFCASFGGGCPTQLYENVDGVVRLVGRIPAAPDTACDDVSGPVCVAASSSQTALPATQKVYSQLSVSSDGRRIYFQSPAGGLASAPLYLREDGVRTEQIAGDGVFWGASTNGARAFFTTTDSLLPADTDSAPDLYMYDREAPAGSRLTLISSGSAGIDGYVEMVVGSSPGGHYVYFVCDGQLIAGEPPADALGLYVWHDGQLRFIGAFQDFNEANANGSRNSWTFNESSRKTRITPDGRYLLFMTTSDAGFVGRGGYAGYDHAGHLEFYLYDTASGRLVCASCNPSRRPATTDAVIDVRDNGAVSQRTSDNARVLTDDGRRVFFNTAEALVPEDTNGRSDAYEYDVPSETMHLLSSGKSTSPSYVIDSTPSGDDVYIVTRDRLVGWDVDNSYDLYDARVGGGFPEPPLPVAACQGEGCRSESTASPSGNPITSLGSRGVGNVSHRLRRHRRCGRRAVLRTVRGKGRCVKRRARRHAKRANIRDERSGR
jgi:hypothetical protein